MMQNNVRVTHPNQKVSGRVQLTGSKSESNRALILQALAKGTVEVENLSAADDTVTLSRTLQPLTKSDGTLQTVEIGLAGTAMRFLSAYLNLVARKFRLTGSKRMQQRPTGL